MENVILISLPVEDLQKIIIECVNSCLKQSHPNNLNQPPPDQWFNLSQLCYYLPQKPSKQTVYGWVHNSQIPFHKKPQKLFFLKSEIDLWLKEGRNKTAKEISLETDRYLSNHKKKSNKN